MITPARNRVTAVITVKKYEASAYEEPAEGPVLSRIHVEESLTGDIAGDGLAQFLQAAGADDWATFVGFERVAGVLAGRRGTFLLQVSGVVESGAVSGDLSVVPGSGTGELTGLRGEGGFRANYGADAPAWMDYWFEALTRTEWTRPDNSPPTV